MNNMVLTNIELGWLAGMYDGEGCVQLQKNKNHITPRIKITTTSEETKDKIYSLLLKLDITAKVYFYDYSDKNKPSWYIEVNRALDVNKLTKALYLVSITKKEQFKIMNIFISSRLSTISNLEGRKKLTGISRKKISIKEMGCYLALRQQNKTGKNKRRVIFSVI